MSNPLGAAVAPAGVNFNLFSRSAAGVELFFFDRVDDTLPSRIIELDPGSHRTYHYWHVSVPGVKPANFMAIACTDRLIRLSACDSIPPRCFWIRMAEASWCRRITVARPRRNQATKTSRP